MAEGARVSLVTGAASGIGRAAALRLAVGGAAIALVDIDAEGLAQTAAGIEAGGGKAIVVEADLRAADAAKRAVRASVAAFGGIDVLVAAAGISPRGSVLETSDEDWETVLGINLTAAFRCCRAVVPVMQARGGGSIVIVGSAWGLVAGPRAAAYAASKGGVVNLARAIAIDHGPEGIRANAVCPGDIDTPLLRGEMAAVGLDPEVAVVESAAGRPVRRVGTPEDAAAAIAYLASTESGYVTGTTLTVDGGWLAGG
ncbi:MAG: SDR family oxidoreductase [Actinobacteria bacterium]|nr:SDR family oxidoreductase [Actinomycetota bacterium]